MTIWTLTPVQAQLQIGSDALGYLNIVFSGVPALVALLLLWFTVVKGPSLELVSGFQAIPWKSPPNTMVQMDTMLQVSRIEIQPIALVFANDGSRSGAITNVDPGFVPSDTFRQFYQAVTANVLVKPQDSQQSLELPAIVSSGGTAVLTLTLTVHLKPWKDIGRASQLIDLPLGEALKKMWDEGKRSLTEFTTFTEEIGRVRLSVQRTRRRWGRIQVTEDDIGPLARVGPIPDWLRDRAKTYLDRFGDLPPMDREVARSVRGIPDFFINDLVTNINTLKNNVASQSTSWLQTQRVKQKLSDATLFLLAG